MNKITLPNNQTLENYILNKELFTLADISQNAYKFWKNIKYAQYPNSRIVFLDKNTIAKKYENLIPKCSNLSGLVLASAFCSMSNLAPSHLNPNNNSNLLNVIKLVDIAGIKFIDLNDFFTKLKIPLNSHIYIEKCCYFAPEPFEKKIKLTNTLCLGYY